MLAGVVGISGSNFGVSNLIGSLDSFETTGSGESLGGRGGRLEMPLGSGFKSAAGAGGGPDAKIRALCQEMIVMKIIQ